MFNIKDIDHLITKKKIRFNANVYNSFQNLWDIIQSDLIHKKIKFRPASSKVKVIVENKIKEKVNVI